MDDKKEMGNINQTEKNNEISEKEKKILDRA